MNRNINISFKFIALLLLCILANVSHAQDVHFTQFTLQPLQQNPAFAGHFDGNYRFGALYRNQWATVQVPYNTLGASVDMKVFQSYQKSHTLGSGLYLNFDQTGDGNYQTLYAQIPLAYHLSFAVNEDSKLTLSTGLSFAYMRKSFQLDNLNFDNQFNGEIFDANASHNEDFSNLNLSNFDLGIGVNLEFQFANNLKIGSGFAVHHLNKIEETYLNDDLKIQLAKRYVIPSFVQIPFGDLWELRLDYLFQEQQQKSEHLFGALGTYYFVNNGPVKKGISFGSYYRWQDAASFVVQYKHNQLTAGFAYDWNVSGLKTATNRYGATEIGIVYLIKKVDKNPSKRKVRCFVF